MESTQALHAEYCRLIDGALALTLDRIYWWEQWRAEGFTVEDLRLVTSCLQRRVENGERNIGCLKWSNLIQSGKFGEELAECKAWKRNLRPEQSAKERVLAQARPVVSEPAEVYTARQVGEIMAKGFEAMRKAAQ